MVPHSSRFGGNKRKSDFDLRWLHQDSTKRWRWSSRSRPPASTWVWIAGKGNLGHCVARLQVFQLLLHARQILFQGPRLSKRFASHRGHPTCTARAGKCTLPICLPPPSLSGGASHRQVTSPSQRKKHFSRPRTHPSLSLRNPFSCSTQSPWLDEIDMPPLMGCLERGTPSVNAPLSVLRGPRTKRGFCDYYRRESETVARCATLGRSQDVCQGFRFTVEGERFVVSS